MDFWYNTEQFTVFFLIKEIKKKLDFCLELKTCVKIEFEKKIAKPTVGLTEENLFWN